MASVRNIITAAPITTRDIIIAILVGLIIFSFF